MTRCRGCGVKIGTDRWCGDCFRAYTFGAMEMLGGLTVSGALGLLGWWLS